MKTVHTYSEDTDEDEHKVSNLTGKAETIYYLLFANRIPGEQGYNPSSEEVQLIATAFLTIAVTASNIDDLLIALNAGVSSITSNISNSYHFSDYGDAEQGQGIDGNINALTFDPVTHQFLLTTNDGQLCSISSSGNVQFIGNKEEFWLSSGLTTIRSKFYIVNSAVNYLYQFGKITGELLNSDENTGKPYEYSNYSFRAIANYGPELFIISTGNEFVKLDSRNGFNDNLIDGNNNGKSNITGMASELVPAEMQLVGIIGNDDENIRSSTFCTLNASTGEIGDLIPLRPNNVGEYRSVMAYADGYLWRVVKAEEEDSGYLTHFEKINLETKERELIYVDNWDGFSGFWNSYPQAMVWTGDRFLCIADSAIYQIKKNGEFTASENTSGLNWAGLCYIYNNVEEIESRQLYGITTDGKLYAVNESTGLPIVNFFGEESYKHITIDGWDANYVTSAWVANNSSYMKVFAYLDANETEPAGWYYIEVDSVGVASNPNLTMYGYSGVTAINSGLAYVYLSEDIEDEYKRGSIYLMGEFGNSLISFLRTTSNTWCEGFGMVDINKELYYATYYYDELIEKENLVLNKFNTHTGVNTLIYENNDLNEPKSLAFNNGIYLCTINGMFKLDSSEEFIQLNDSVTQINGMAFIGDVLYGVQDDASFNTINLNTGLLTNIGNITIEGRTISGFVGLTNFNDVLYAVMVDEDSNRHLITINPDTLIGTYIGPTPYLSAICSAICPKQTGKIGDSWFWEDENNRIQIHVAEDPSGNVETEIYPYDFSDFGRPPEAGWKRVDIYSINEIEGGWVVVLNHPIGPFTIRYRYRNPNSAWSYARWD